MVAAGLSTIGQQEDRDARCHTRSRPRTHRERAGASAAADPRAPPGAAATPAAATATTARGLDRHPRRRGLDRLPGRTRTGLDGRAGDPRGYRAPARTGDLA